MAEHKERSIYVLENSAKPMCIRSVGATWMTPLRSTRESNAASRERSCLSALCLAPNKALQLTWQHVTRLAKTRGRGAPRCHAAELGR